MAAVRAVSLGGFTNRLVTRLPAVAPMIKPALCQLRVRTAINAPLVRWMSDGPPNIHGDLSPNDVSSKAMKRRLAARHAAEVSVAARVAVQPQNRSAVPAQHVVRPLRPVVQRRTEAEATVIAPPQQQQPADPWTAALQQYTSPAPATTVPPPAPPAPAGGYFAQQQQQPLPPLTESLKHYFVAGIAIALAFTVVRVLFGG